MSFSAIPVRSNGEKFYYSWFNLLRTAGVALEGFLGAGYIGETSFTLANNTGPANVTGLIIDKTLYKSAQIFAEVRRKTATNEAISNGKITIQYRDNTTTWELLDELNGDDDGVVFTVNASTGQIQYTSDNMSGTGYSGTIKFKVMTFSV
jgi:stress response protein SCP2